jgi:hypothetical protein
MSAHKDEIKGGLADKKDPKDLPPKQLKMGKRVEKEHTNNPALSREIAMDHLVEDKHYYSKLKKMEKKGEMTEQEATEKSRPFWNSAQRYVMAGTPAGAALGYLAGRKLKHPVAGTIGGAMVGFLGAGAAHHAVHGDSPYSKWNADQWKKHQTEEMGKKAHAFFDELGKIYEGSNS